MLTPEMVHLGRATEALAAYEKSIEINTTLAQADPGVIEYRKDLSDALNGLAILHQQERNMAAAVATYRRAIETAESLFRENPQSTELALGLAFMLNNFGILHRREGRPAEALDALQRAVQIKEKLVQDHPTRAMFQASLAKSYSSLGTLQSSSGNPAQGVVVLSKAVEMQERLRKTQPANIETKAELALFLNNLALVLRKNGQTPDALANQQRAIAINRELVEKQPANVAYCSELMKCWVNLAVLQREVNSHQEAASSFLASVDAATAFLRAMPRYKTIQLLLRDAQWNRTVREARGLVDLAPQQAVVLRRQAAVHALVAAAAIRDGSLDDSVREPILRDETAIAVSLLQQAHKAGYFSEAQRVQDLQDDADLAAIRDREEFRDFTSTLKERK